MLLFFVDGKVRGVTRLHDVVHIVCQRSPAIIRFDAKTHERLADITVKGLSYPYDIAACQQTDQLYVTDRPITDADCVWRVSSNGEDVNRLLTNSPLDTFRPYTLSVTSSRLLVTSLDTRQLRQFDAVGDELRRVDLPDNMIPRHAVESPSGSFIVSCGKTRLKRGKVSEVNTKGQVLRQFSGSRLLPLGGTPYVAVDSEGNIFVAGRDNGVILLLDSRLTLRRVIIEEHQLNYNWPRHLCYVEKSGQLLAGTWFDRDVAVFDVLRR